MYKDFLTQFFGLRQVPDVIHLIRCIVGLEIKLPSKLEAVIYSLPLCKAFG